METLKIVKDQPFVFWIPTIMLNAYGEQEIDANTLTDVVITASSGCDKYTIAHHAHKHWLVLEFDDSLKIGPYRITITGFLEGGRKFCLALAKPLEIVNWDSESNWDRFIIGDHIELTDHPFITGEFLTDAEIEELKEEYREKNTQLDKAIADAEEAKLEWEHKSAELDGVAQESTSHEILTAVEKINVDSADKLAQFFGLPSALPEYQQMTEQEVTDTLEDIMGSLDTDLGETVEYPEGSGQYMTRAQAITAQVNETINN